ncbi:hypothetical protein [Pseudomonas piscis]|uniref:hypothetical protein n=1 Tax=Pseudomonas piscis TaxID=2614538 RepID=UPI0021D5DA61|nr:hypothetical protein [Pseudomonas piscis]MCU7647606.1 hypothetical protein [Pseudomonas piscis]
MTPIDARSGLVPYRGWFDAQVPWACGPVLRGRSTRPVAAPAVPACGVSSAVRPGEQPWNTPVSVSIASNIAYP